MHNIFHRISVRKHEDKPVEKENHGNPEGGNAGASACNQRPWEFYVVTDKEKSRNYPK
ncbi:MAG: hypothetical protein ACLVHS_07960 [Blautia wexlerae]